jgi:hypothetical protein
VILVGFTPLYYFNPITIGFLALLIFQIIVKNAISGLVIAGSFLIIHLFMLVALVVEFYEFAGSGSSGQQLLIVGFSIWVINMFFIGVMLYKHVSAKMLPPMEPYKIHRVEKSHEIIVQVKARV